MKHVVVSSAGETQPFYSAIFNPGANICEKLPGMDHSLSCLPLSLRAPFPLPSRPVPSFPLPLEVGPLKSSKGVWVSAVSSHSGVWGGAPAKIEFGAF